MTSRDRPPPVTPVDIGKPSLRSRMAIAALRLTRAKKTFADVDALHESIRKNQRLEHARPPAELHIHHWVTLHRINGRPVYKLRPQFDGSGRHVLYLHGGAYVHQIQHGHWNFLSRLIDRTGCTVTVPLYPLAPDCHYEDTLAMVDAAYEASFTRTAPQDTVFMGDSGGAALALVLARHAEAAGRPAPKDVVLVSPWLDVTMTDPAEERLDACDPYLGIPGLAEAGRLYAGRGDRRDPRISPLNAPTETPGRLSLFVGTRDILLADARRFRARCANEGTDLDYYEYPGMFHAWHTADIPEARHALRQVARIVRRPADS